MMHGRVPVSASQRLFVTLAFGLLLGLAAPDAVLRGFRGVPGTSPQLVWTCGVRLRPGRFASSDRDTARARRRTHAHRSSPSRAAASRRVERSPTALAHGSRHEELLASIPQVATYARAEGEQFANVSSSELTLDQWLALSRRHQRAVCRAEADLAGVVVTSGTDTLEEIAYFLHLTVRDDRPVVVVGSMRNPSTIGYEGAANLLEGFRVAADPASRGLGALVVLNDEINSAREVTKTDALRLQTFQSRVVGALGVVDQDRVVYYREARAGGRRRAPSST